MRRPFVAGNWKMNLNLEQARALVAGIAQSYSPDSPCEAAICPPFIYLFPMAKAVHGTGIGLGAQDVFHEPSGAFTGETAPAMVADTGARYVIIGHSERRHTIGHLEDDWMINRKLRAARGAELTPILCVGETLSQREANQTMAVLTFQLDAALSGYEVNSSDDLVIAYEPVWAIGTGKVATPDQAQEAHAHLRRRLRELRGETAEDTRILYGGSVKPDNAAEIFRQADVDGGLIGGASLKADQFAAIVKAAERD